MSQYLVDRLLANPKITVRGDTEVTRLEGEQVLESISLVRTGSANSMSRHAAAFSASSAPSRLPAGSPASPSTSAASSAPTSNSRATSLGETLTALGRVPLPFETSVPGVFAVGDVRHGSMKRVAAAVGEGATAVRSVHTAIGVRA